MKTKMALSVALAVFACLCAYLVWQVASLHAAKTELNHGIARIATAAAENHLSDGRPTYWFWGRRAGAAKKEFDAALAAYGLVASTCDSPRYDGMRTYTGAYNAAMRELLRQKHGRDVIREFLTASGWE